MMRIVSKRAAVTAGFIVVMVAGHAAAAPKWTPVVETPMKDIASYVFDGVALAPGGGALVGGTTVTIDGRLPAVIERSARGAAWTNPVPLAAAGRLDVGPLVARNARGDALVVWGAVGGPLVAAVRSGGGAWRPVTAVGAKLPALRTGRPSDTVKIALSSAGVARVVVASCGSRCVMTEYRTSVRRPRWIAGKPRRLPAAATPSLQWDVSSAGHLIAAWIRPAPLAVQAIVQRPRDTKPAPPLVVTRGGGATGPLDVEIGERGEAAVAWTGVVGTLQTSVRLPSDVRWRSSRGIIRGAGAAGSRIGLACDGSLVAAWVEPGDEVRATTAAGPGGPFNTPSKIGIYGAVEKPVAVAASTAGVHGVVTWARAEQESAGMSIARIGDPDDAFRTQNPDFAFRDHPAPVFASDGFGIVVGASDDALRVQEIEPDPERFQCAR
jgi:hypothetical protein